MAPEPVGIVNGMARNQQTDVPAIVLHALIGNVCGQLSSFSAASGHKSPCIADAAGACANRTCATATPAWAP